MVNWKRLSLMMAAAFLLAACVHTSAFAGPLEDGKAAADNGDARTAMKILLPLAEQGNAEAQCRVGLLYVSDADYAKVLKEEEGQENGYFGNEAQDRTEAEKWFRRAADQGYARAQYDIGTEYEYGTGVTKDLKEAMNWYKKSADQGDPWGQSVLGDMYRDGRGIQKDYVKAYMWYSLAASANDVVSSGAGYQRDLIAAKMTLKQITAAKHLLASWKPTPAPSQQ